MKKIIYTMLALAMGCTTSMAKKITTINDLVGQYINKTTSMKEDPKFEGSSVTIHVAEDDTIIIYNLFDYGTELKAKVNMADCSLTIPSQLFYTDKTYGESDFTNITLTTSSLSPDRKTPVTGTIDPETGIITLNPWAVYINSGPYMDHYFDVVEKTVIKPANGLMHNSYFVGSDGKPQYEDDESNVILRMNEAGDSLIVENFGDKGLDVSIKLYANHTVSIPRQKVYDADDYKYGDFYTQSADWAADKYNATGITGTWDEDGVTLDNWTSSSTSNYYLGKIAKTTIKFTDGTKLSTTDGIARTTADDQAEALSTQYFSLDGARLQAPQKGVNVVVKTFADGKTRTFKTIMR